MSAPTTPACPLGLSADDLSAWRDQALPAAAAERISAHASGCLACQRIIAMHEALAAAAQAEQPPAPDPRAWLRLQARIAASQQSRRAPANPSLSRARRPAVWGGLGAAAAVLLLSALFIHLFAQQALVRGGSSHTATATTLATPVATPQPIPTHVAPTVPIAGTPLVWQTREGPADLIPKTSSGDLVHANEMVFSPTDARTAYACSVARGATTATVDVWATHDGARTWKHVNTTNYGLAWYGCKLNIDADEPMRVELTLVTLYGNVTSTSQSLLSDDGGQTWRHLADGQMLTNLVTRGKVSVGMIRQWPPLLFSQPHPTPTLQELQNIEQVAVSRDDWRTWQPIDSAFWAQGLMVKDVWQRPGDGALLASAISETGEPNPADDAQLWQSIDLGAHWTRIPTPPNLRADGGFLVGQPQGNAPWHACGIMFVGKEVNQPTTLVACTLDSGQTWQTRPMPVFMSLCGSYCEGEELASQPEMLPDGSLLAPFSAGVASNGAQQSDLAGHLYLLPPSANQWQDIGRAGSGADIVIGGPTTTLVSLPNMSYRQIPTDELGEPFGSFISGSPLGEVHAFAIATLP
jgi:hypothetical protein